ncbi:MAG: magnesium transporter CorA [Lachnospiraceae bacterium]|nr:magnesium transporter CorA [Lachnospiraceae bacterium]
MYYLINEKLHKTSFDELKKNKNQYVAVITSKEWKEKKDSFDMGIDIETETKGIYSTKAEVNFDSLTGTFCIPDRKAMSVTHDFYFALDEKGIVFIDDNDYVSKIVESIRHTKKWRLPSLERFIYDFLEYIVKDDREKLERIDKELDIMEDGIVTGTEKIVSERVNDIRTEIRDLRGHYEELLDFSQELEENENNFFKQDNLRYFRLFSRRIERLKDATIGVSDHALQIRDIYKAYLDIKQNRIVTVLTIVTTVFMPLTVIAGWYGMNFQYMPELTAKWGYPTVIIVSVLIVTISLLYFKIKKWL